MGLKDIKNLRVSRVALVGGEQDDPVAGIGRGDKVRQHAHPFSTGVIIGLNLPEFLVYVDWNDDPPTWVSPGELTVTEKGVL